MPAHGLEVAIWNGQAGQTADLDGLGDGLKQRVVFAADMAGVDAPVRRRHLGQSHDFEGRCITARHVDQTGTQTESPVTHGPIHQGAHLLQLRRGRRPVVEAHD